MPIKTITDAMSTSTKNFFFFSRFLHFHLSILVIPIHYSPLKSV